MDACCSEVAACLGLDRGAVFWFDRGNRTPVVAVWIAGLTSAEINRCTRLKPEIKAIAQQYGAKVYLTHRNPHDQEEIELKKRRGGAFRNLSHAAAVSYRQSNWNLQKGRCAWCNKYVPLNQATLEHIIPLSAGGSNDPKNLAMSCGPCNWGRHREPRIVAWLKLLRFRAKMALKRLREGQAVDIRRPVKKRRKRGKRRPLYRPKAYPDEHEHDAMIDALKKCRFSGDEGSK